MIAEPKSINVPGIDTPLREQTLAEYCQMVPSDHLINVELRELLSRARRLNELEHKLKEIEARAQEESMASAGPGASLPQKVLAPYDPKRKVPCRYCQKPISVGVGYWKNHLKSAHPDADQNIAQIV